MKSDFVLVMLLPAMSFGDTFCFSRKGGTGGGEWVHPKGANRVAASGLGCRKALVGTGWAISLLLCMNRLRKQPSGLVGSPFLTMMLFFSLHGWSLAESCD